MKCLSLCAALWMIVGLTFGQAEIQRKSIIDVHLRSESLANLKEGWPNPVAGFIFAAVSRTAAQDAVKAQAPGPEYQRLGFLVGTWEIERATQKTPYQPAEEKRSYTQIGEWFEGHFRVLCRLQQTRPTRPYGKVSIFGYDPEAGTYFCDVYMSMGQRISYTGTRAGKTWTFVSDSKEGGKTFKYRWTIIEESSTLTASKVEFSEDGGPWILASEAKWTRM
jgi:hypothetical protein